jgi:hypothetical protein
MGKRVNKETVKFFIVTFWDDKEVNIVKTKSEVMELLHISPFSISDINEYITVHAIFDTGKFKHVDLIVNESVDLDY